MCTFITIGSNPITPLIDDIFVRDQGFIKRGDIAKVGENKIE